APAVATTAPPGIVTSTMRGRGFTLSIDVEPAIIGANEFHLYANTPDGDETTIRQWQVSVANSARRPRPITAPALPITAPPPAPGTWRFSISVRTDATDEETVYADIPIADLHAGLITPSTHAADRVPVPQGALLGNARLGGVVDPHDAEPLLVAIGPLEVVHQ